VSEKVVKRIRDLLRLAQSDNRHEAANALAHAQRLMQRHRIERAQLDEPDDEEIRFWQDEPIDERPIIDAWRQAIGGAIAEVNDCVCLVSDKRSSNGRRIMLIAGRRSDFEACRVMYQWITTKIEELAGRTNSKWARSLARGGMGRRFLNSFRMGAAAEVERRIYQEQEKSRIQLEADPKTSQALAIRHDAVHQWAEENVNVHEPATPSLDVDAAAYEAGAIAGRFMPLRAPESE